MTKYPFVIIALLALISCTDENMTFQIGNNDLDVKTNIRYIDTLTVKSYTILMDSIVTSGLESPALLVGKYSDTIFGNIGAQSFFRVGLPASGLSLPKDAVFDSIRLYLLYNNYYTGDTTREFALHVHRLSKALKPNSDGKFYNTTNISYEPAPLGSVVLSNLSPNSADTLWIDLDLSFGNELFTLLMSKDERVSDNLSFLNYLRGFMLGNDESNQAIAGFQYPSALSSAEQTKNPAMRLYFHYFDYEKRNKFLDFNVQEVDYNLQFNHFSLDRLHVLDILTDQRASLSSSITHNATYLLAGVGMATRFEVPYLKNLFDFNANIKILDAELEFKPVRNSYKNFTLPQQLSIYASDSRNHFGQVLYNKDGDAQTGNLYTDYLYQVDTRYQFDITNFLDGKLREETDEAASMLLTVSPDNLYKTLDRLILGSQLNTRERMTLKVYYMYYE